ncbi:SWIM-type domain-containing protein [Camponotus japonicus]
MLGPYPANLNDAEILRSLLQDSNALCKLLKENDIIVLDRGFRDVKDELELKKIRVLMPALKGKRKQLTTKESNESRYVTKIRWAVEAVHGIIKQKYRLLDHKLDNKMLPKIGTYFRIASFLNNQFGKRLQSDAEFSSEIIKRMRVRKAVENTLAAEAEEKGWLRKKLVFQSISSEDILDFPDMTITDLTILFTGTYQLSQAVSYLAEMIDTDGQVKVQYVKEQSNVLKLQVPSRHINRKMYRCFLKYKPNSVGISGLLEYACDCANGSRTVGCCSHIAAIVYYLAYARYLSKIFKPAEILSKMFQQNNIIPVIEDDSDED